MRQVLFLTTSAQLGKSKSGQIANRLLDGWRAANPGLEVVERDLGAAPVPHLGADLLGGFFAAPEQHSTAQAKAVALSNTLIGELEAADTLVIATPMYNFSIPSTLKAWIDHITRAGRTFRYTESGPVGLLTGKRAFIVVSRGGVYSEGAAKALDFQEPYLRAILGFVGITDVTFIYAEAQALGPEAAQRGLDAAHAAIARLAA
jgi:FMN-dependent NADH-azoreductase